MTDHRFRTLAARTALAACLAVAVAACGDDDDEGAPSADDGGEQAAGGDACDAIVEFNAAVMDVDTEGASDDELASMGEELAAVWAPIDENAPDEVADQAGSISDALSDLAAGDAEAFDSDSTFEAYTEVMSATVAECGFETVAATAVDYGFEGIPETVPAGTVALELTNEGEEVHEMIIFQKPEGDTRSAEELLNDPAMEESGPPPAGFVFAAPGQSATGLAELAAGDYFAVCFIPVGTTEMPDGPPEGDGGPPHFTQGMLTEFTVE